MTARRAARPLALVACLALLVGACGGSTPTASPGATPTDVATAPPATLPPATQPPVGGATIDPLASFHGAQDLEGLLPDAIGGVTMTKASLSGEAFMGMGSSTELQTALTALGKQPSDLSVAFGGAGTVTIFAFQIKGVPGSQILSALFAAYQSTTGSVTDASFGGKSVKKVVPTDSSGISYIYTAQDVVFVVAGGTAVTDAQLNEAFSKLP